MIFATGCIQRCESLEPDARDPCAGVDPAEGKVRRHALLVGVESYYHEAHGAAAWSNLSGPGNDLESMAGLLRDRGFKVRCLFDRAATRAGIEAAFRAHLVEGLRPGSSDVGVFYFSGHGQQIPDDVGPDEADGYDEALVPYDHRGREDPSGHLRDDQLGEWVSKVSADAFAVIIDSCHSGTATRGRLSARGGPPTLPPAAPTRGASTSNVDDYARGRAVISAARANQAALEYEGVNGRVQGAFTTVLVEMLADGSSIRSYRELVDATAARLHLMGYAQSPVYEGRADGVVFSQSVLTRRFRPRVLLEGSGSRAFVEAGAQHGLEVGVTLAVFSSTQNPSRAELVRLPKLRVVEVGAKSAEVEVPPGSSLSDLRARLGPTADAMVFSHPKARLRVRAETLRPQLEATLEDFPMDANVVAGSSWDVDVRAQDGLLRLVSASGDPVRIPVSSGETATLAWARSDDADADADALARAIVSESRRRALLAFASTLPPQDRPRLELDVLPAVYDPGTGACSPVPTGATDRRLVGRCFELSVAHASAAAPNVVVYAVEPDGRIQLLVRDRRLRPGRNRLGTFQQDIPGSTVYAALFTETRLSSAEVFTYDPFADARGGGAMEGAHLSIARLDIDAPAR